MIFRLEDIIEDLYKEFPAVNESDLKKAVKKCFAVLNRILKTDNDFIGQVGNEQFMIFRPTGPDVQQNRAMHSLRKKIKKNEKANDK